MIPVNILINRRDNRFLSEFWVNLRKAYDEYIFIIN